MKQFVGQNAIFLPRNSVKTVNTTSVFSLKMSTDSQLRKHTVSLTIKLYASNDERVLQS